MTLRIITKFQSVLIINSYLTPQSSRLVAGVHSKKAEEGCRITNVGHDRDGEGCPVQVILSDMVPAGSPIEWFTYLGMSDTLV